MYLRTLAVCPLIFLLLGADKDTPRAADKELEGSWEIVSAIRDGGQEPLPEGKAVLTFKENTLTVKVGQKEEEKGTIKVDATRTPRLLTIEPSEGPDKGKTILAIYEVKGDALRLCSARPGKERPTEFSSREGSGHLLANFKRVKP